MHKMQTHSHLAKCTMDMNMMCIFHVQQTVAPIFGPKGDLYIPISSIVNGPAANNFTGGYRKYTVPNANLFKKTTINNHTLDFETTVTPNLVGGPLAAPFYSTFGRSDPGTLEYLCLV